MMHRTLTLGLWALVLCACSDGSSDGPTGPGNGEPPSVGLAVEVVAQGLEEPVFLTAPEGDPRLFVVELPGRIRVIEDGTLLPTPFLDITDEVRSAGGEQGLFSVAFHPDYDTNGFFYVNYTAEDTGGGTRVERYTVSADPGAADALSAKTILSVAQPFTNHNGGLVTFGPDGMLWVGMGDGGSGGDPQGNGQDPTTLLGALLRLDVDGGDPYAAPPGNPYVGDPGGADEVWAIGLRNPWRFAFDPAEELLYVADVGQSDLEEVSVVSASQPGLNFGWNVMEGDRCFEPAEGCDTDGLVLPAVTYPNAEEGCSITGGYVYRGSAIPDLRGHYFYSDFCAGFLRSFRFTGSGPTEEEEWDVGDLGNVLSFGRDSEGELYVLSGNGVVGRIVEAEGGL